MFISIFAIIGFFFFIVLIYTLFFSTSDEIPVSSKLPELPKSDQVYQPPQLEKTSTLSSASDTAQKDQQFSEPSKTNRTRPAISYENEAAEQRDSKQKVLSQPKKYSYSTSFQKLCEHPRLISFNALVATADFGCNREGKTHYFICMLFYPFLILFRLVLYIVSWIGTLFFNIVIRFMVELIIRIVWFVINVFVRSIGSLFD